MRSLPKVLALAGTLCAATLATGDVLAGGSSVSPTRLVFAKSQASSYLAITNTGTTPQRYSVAAYDWDETNANPIALSDTNDVLFFPGSFTSEAFQTQRIRIGTVSAASSLERTYRIVVSELPPLKNVLEPQTTGLAFTTSYSVPIYVAPLVPVVAGEIGDVTVDRDHLRFTIRDIGNVHFVAKTMRVSARGESGTILSAENSAWFVLAKKEREFTFPIRKGSCDAIKSVSISVDAERLKFDRTVIPEHSCG